MRLTYFCVNNDATSLNFFQGEMGRPGPQGEAGTVGEKGDRGVQGPTGTRGLPGPPVISSLNKGPVFLIILLIYKHSVDSFDRNNFVIIHTYLKPLQYFLYTLSSSCTLLTKWVLCYF